jgi:nitrate reductase delta subunit
LQETAVRIPILGLFADILDYPRENALERLKMTEESLEADFPEAAPLLSSFRAAIDGLTLERLQEVYTAIFDLNATCHPYIGYQLFGETYKRSVFMVELKEHYRNHGFESDDTTELADRLGIMLRFVSQCDDEELVTDIIDYGFAPSLAKMTKVHEPSVKEPETREPNPYTNVMKALQIVLGHGDDADDPAEATKKDEGDGDVR